MFYHPASLPKIRKILLVTSDNLQQASLASSPSVSVGKSVFIDDASYVSERASP